MEMLNKIIGGLIIILFFGKNIIYNHFIKLHFRIGYVCLLNKYSKLLFEVNVKIMYNK